jgi:5,6,7,8-tetrahydromethanopterin hydro-lyase
MIDPLLFRVGEATVFASEGQYTDAMPEILIGRADGPVGQAFANMMGQSAGHTRMFAIRACNQLVKPPTMMVPKVTIKDMATAEIFGGVVQAATGDAIVDCLIEGILPRDQIDALCIVCLIWIDPRAPKHAALDHAELYRNNYEATKLAVKRAMAGEPTVDELIAKRHSMKHEMYDPQG